MKKFSFTLLISFLMFSVSNAQDGNKTKNTDKKDVNKNTSKNSVVTPPAKGKSGSILKPVEPVATTSIKVIKVAPTVVK